MESTKPKVLVCISGGVESAATCLWFHNEFFDVYGLHCNYGQTNYYAEDLAIQNWKSQGLILDYQSLKFPNIWGIDKYVQGDAQGFFCMRNTIFISMAAALAYERDITHVSFGAAITDTFYYDTSHEHSRIMEELIINTSAGHVGLVMPLQHDTKEVLYQWLLEYDIPTVSCNNAVVEDGKIKLCQTCEACADITRIEGLYGIRETHI